MHGHLVSDDSDDGGADAQRRSALHLRSPDSRGCDSACLREDRDSTTVAATAHGQPLSTAASSVSHSRVTSVLRISFSRRLAEVHAGRHHSTSPPGTSRPGLYLCISMAMSDEDCMKILKIEEQKISELRSDLKIIRERVEAVKVRMKEQDRWLEEDNKTDAFIREQINELKQLLARRG